MKMTANTSFYFQSEMWLKGETKDVNAHYANELKMAGLIDEAKKGETVGAKAPSVQPSFADLNKPPKPAENRETKPAKTKLETK